MEIISVTSDNIAKEHICCAITDKKGETCVSSKKAWLSERFSDGLVFKKLDVRGKVFIEYIPAEKAWCPIIAGGYIHIDCFWVSGQFKGQGYANKLLEECVNDAKALGKHGITILSSKKKMPFLSDPQHLKYKGFKVADTALPYYELLYLPFDSSVPVPKFRELAKNGVIEEKGLVLYWSNQCPHTDKYVQLINNIAKNRGAMLKLVKFENATDAQNSPTPFTTYSLFDGGKFVTNEIFSEAKFNKFLDER